MTTQLTQFILQASNENRFLEPDELERIKRFVKSGEQKLKIAQTLTELRYFIVKQSGKLLSKASPDVFQKGGNAFGIIKTAKCLRDIDYYLRLIIYGIVAGSVQPIEDIGLIGAREVYMSLGTPLSAIANAVYAMKTVVSSCLSREDISIVEEYFDFVISYFIEGLEDFSKIEDAWENIKSSQLIKQDDTILEPHYSSNNIQQQHNSWEPQSYEDFLQSDRLVNYYLRNHVLDHSAFEESCQVFYENWKTLPYHLRRRVWREREVISHLCSHMNRWTRLPGFSHIGVSFRNFAGEDHIVGVLVFNEYISEEISESLYEKFDTPRFIDVDSLIDELEPEEENPIPIIFEYSLPKIELHSAEPEMKTTSMDLTQTLLQSGDVIAGKGSGLNLDLCNPRKVTLSCFVVDQDKSFIEDGLDGLRLMSVWHGFKGGCNEVFVTEPGRICKVGDIDFNSDTDFNKIRQKELAIKLDVCLVKPLPEVDFDPYLKWVDEPPGNVAIVWSGMLVQMWGGQSGHVSGFVNHSMAIFPGSASSAIPDFNAIIESKPGDSGALLVSGNNTGDPVENPESKGFGTDLISGLRFASLGILVSGSMGGSYQNLSYFRPMPDICQQLKIKPFLFDLY